MPTAPRGRRLRRLSPGTFYAALGELPRGALNIRKTRRKRRRKLLSCRLGSLAELRHACHVTVRVKCLVMGARFECLRAAFVEDHLLADVVIALRIGFQLSLGRRY